MKEKKDNNRYCTNMDDDDPIIEKFIKEYLKEKEDTKRVPKNDDLIVNFDITYADGTTENHTCRNESMVFGRDEESRIDKEENRNSSEKCNNYDIDIESEMGKWSNCVDEWCECSNKENLREDIKECDKKSDKEDVIREEKCNCKGKITVYSILSVNKSTTLKGVTVNLYKINGVKPELVCSKETDEDGKVIFEHVDNGNYRIIQLIDKRYFDKPVYLTWNEVNITDDNKDYLLYVLNTLKNYRKN